MEFKQGSRSKIDSACGTFLSIHPLKMSAPRPQSMRWYKKAAFDAPELNSPQPCAHGAGCEYKTTHRETGEQVEGCCAFVHPGEEGTGRRLFEECVTENEDGTKTVKAACVRLTGRAGFYERRRLRLSWRAWCEREGIPYRPNSADEHVEITPAVERLIQAAVERALASQGDRTPQRAPRPASTNAPPRAPRGPRFVDDETPAAAAVAGGGGSGFRGRGRGAARVHSSYRGPRVSGRRPNDDEMPPLVPLVTTGQCDLGSGNCDNCECDVD
jgi:hypothetical protein